MKLHCFTVGDHVCDIIPAGRKRDWMDAYSNQHAYRCLPLAIANTYGWQLLCPCDLEIVYTGGDKKEDVIVRSTDGADVNFIAESNFSRGVVTFYTNYIFQTEPGWQLFATGPLNEPKDGLYPLSGVIETDWLPYPFTMNWQITRPGTYTWKKGEPFCQIFVTPKNQLETIQPEIYKLEDNADLLSEKENFQQARAEFRKKMDEGDEEAIKQGWQRYYFKGKVPGGKEAPVKHTNKLRLNTPEDKRGTPVKNLFETKKVKKFTFVQTVHEVQKEPVHVTKPKQDNKIQLTIEEENRFYKRPTFIPTHNLEGYNSPEEYPLIDKNNKDYDFLYLENFINPEECQIIMDCFERNIENTVNYADEMFKNRVIWMTSLKENEQRARSIMQQARFGASYLAQKFFKEEKRLYDDVPQLVKWSKGMSMPAHADNEHPDTNETHQTPHRKYGGVTYLNDSYSGGDLFFEKLKLRIPPKQGSIVLFKGDMSHMHGVTEVTNGVRYTMPMWLSLKETDFKTIKDIY